MGLGVHLDLDGNERVGNQWGFNSFTTLDGARKSLRGYARRGSGTWYIWRLADDTYDWTCHAAPDIPGHPATLVEKYAA